MQITTTKEMIAARLAMVAGAADGTKATPILGSVLLKTVNGNLSLLCSDTGVLARTLSECTVKKEGEICVDSRRLGDLVRAIPDKQQVELCLEEKGKLLVKAGKSRFRLDTFPAADYPRMSSGAGDAISEAMKARELGDMVERVIGAMASGDVRVYLNGVLFSIKNKRLTLVATDGHRLSVVTVPVEVEGAVECIVPRKTVLLLRKLLARDGDVKVTIRQTEAQFSFADGSVLLARAIEGRFPDWERVTPAEPTNFITIGRGTIKETLSMMAALSDSATKDATSRLGIELAYADTALTLKKGDTAQSEIPVIVTGETSGSVGVNLDYLQDAIDSVGDVEAVRVGFYGPNSAILVTQADGSGVKTVVMPMRL